MRFLHRLSENKRIPRLAALFLAAVIVFSSTYMLILPALTIETEDAELEAGVELDEPNIEAGVEPDEPYIEAGVEPDEPYIEAGVDSAAGGDAIVEPDGDPAAGGDSIIEPELIPEDSDIFIENQDIISEDASVSGVGAGAEAAQEVAAEAADAASQEAEAGLESIPAAVSMPAVTFTENTREESTEDLRKVTVSVEAEEGTFPEGTLMAVTEISDNDSINEAVEKAVSNSPEVTGTVGAMQAVDIAFFDPEGNRIEPLKPVKVTLSSDFINEAYEPVLVHVPNEVFDPYANDNAGNGSVYNGSGATGETEIVAQEDVRTQPRKQEDEIIFISDAFSVYAIVYTVDFSYSVNGLTYEFSIDGGGAISLSRLAEVLGIIEGTEFESISSFINEVQNVEFSDPALVSVTKDPEGSDWTLTSLAPFDTEETLTITMKNGDVITVAVTDAQEIPDSSSETINVNKSYLICYEVDGHYYLLKNDGTVDDTHTPATFENLNSTYCWTFNYVFEEKHLDETLTYVYYLIRPIDNKTKTIALNEAGQPIVIRSNNNVAVVPDEEGGFRLTGYNNTYLGFENGQFCSVYVAPATEDDPEPEDRSIVVHIYEMDTLPTYTYKVQSADQSRGTVSVVGGTPKSETVDGVTVNYIEAESNSDKKNVGKITATPVSHPDGDGDNKWLFDHWTQDGIILDRDQYPATINAEDLPIPFNGSTLVAYFKQNKQYNVPDNEKQPTTIEDLTDWIDDLSENHVPLDEEATTKTAEVYDYQNRIYRVDIASKANFKTFKGNVDMAFCMDVSNSMYFPASLVDHTTLPIYQINDSGWNWDNRGWLDRSRNWNNPYYLIADGANTATVFKIYYQDGNWKAQDASRTTESDRSFKIGDTFQTNWAGNTNHPFNAGDDNNTTYTIYNAGDSRNRFYYLNQAFISANSDLTEIKDILAVAGSESPNVRVAYNTFNLNLGSQRQDFQTVRPVSAIDLSNSHGGGTRPDQAFIDAQTFDWQGDDRYVILITDGAPQGKRTGESDNDFERISQDVMDEADDLKRLGGVKFITIGLSLDKVPHGKKLLYDLADDDKDGNKMFFMADDASELPNILRQVVKTIMDDAVVLADVTDTVGEAFYPVDKETGLPLKPGDMIDIEGRLTADKTQAAGIVLEDGMTIKWTEQAVDSTIGWHGTVFVKAKEDLLGGNAVKTNGDAQIEAKKYVMGDDEYTFDDSLIGDKLKSLEIGFDSPRVNVNELSFPSESTEWTVYLGTEVDPKTQLKSIYEDILVSEVVNTDGSLHYPIEPNSITDKRSGNDGTEQTFPLAGLILDHIKEDAGLASLYVEDGELNWDAFLTDIMKSGGVTVPYHAYGIEGDDSNIVITLSKTIEQGEEDDLVNASPHDTTVVNNGDVPVEKYVLTIQYNPDYNNVLPAGQGGHGHYNYSTGSYGAMYQGHAAGRETSTNNHVINVYKKTVDVLKTDENDAALSGATFKLYKKDEENGAAVKGLSGKYTEVASAVSGPDGIAHLDSSNEDILLPGVTYYLVEDSAPQNYTKVNTVWAVEVQTEIGKFTDIKGNPIYSTLTPDPDSEPPVTAGTGVTEDMYPFNWDQGARIVLDGEQPLAVIAKGDEEGTTVTITDGSFVSSDRAISFRHKVENIGGKIGITVNKSWDDDNDSGRPASVNVKLYRVSEKGHIFEEGRVVPCTCTVEGVKEYTCSECGETDTHVITAAGHTPGTPHRENETAATCTDPGGYDTVVRCTVCNAVISSEHTDTEAAGHTWGEPEEVETSEDGYCFDTVVKCTVCGAEQEGSRQHHDHVWGEWTETTPAQPGVAGEETRVCERDPSHTETRTTEPLPLDHTVTIYFRCTGNGSGRIDFPGQITNITSRTGTGIGDMTIQWDWNSSTLEQPFDVDGLVGGSTYESSWTRRGNTNYGGRQTLTIHNITQDLVIYVTIRNYNWAGTEDRLIYQPTFTGVPNRSAGLLSRSLKSAAAKQDMLLEALEAEEATQMTSDELEAYLESLSAKEDVSCAEGEDHIYKEQVGGTYTVTADSGWTLPIEDLSKFNEYGNEYTYYVVEDGASSGYEVTYTGEDSGLSDKDSVTITNTLKKGSLDITKEIRKNGVTDPDGTGTYYYAVYSAADVDPETGEPITGRTAAAAGALSVTENGTKTVTVNDLPYGIYYVYELDGENGNIIESGQSGSVNKINGTVYEVTGSGATAEVGDTNGTSTLVNDVRTIKAKVHKEWNDNSDSAGKRPDSLTVQLVARNALDESGVESLITSVTLNDENNWTSEETQDLPVYDENCQPISYHWIEGDMPAGYFLTGYASSDIADGVITSTLTNTLHTYDLKTSYSGVKTWNDSGNVWKTRPSSDDFTVTLYEIEKTGGSYPETGTALSLNPEWTFDESTNQWTYIFKDLPVFDDNGEVIKYYAKETVPGGYEKTAEDNEPTTYHQDEIDWSEVQNKIDTGRTLEWELKSLINVAFIAIKTTGNMPTVVWSNRVLVPAEEDAIRSGLVDENKLPGCNPNLVFYSGSAGTIDTGHGTVTVDFNEETMTVYLTFGSHDSWSKFIYGDFNKNDQTQYDIGHTDFTNDLLTTEITGSKTWITADGEAHDNATDITLRLMRKSAKEGAAAENLHAVSADKPTVYSEDVTEYYLQPVWDGNDYSYTGLPAKDKEGYNYTYTVYEQIFKVGDVTYTAVKGEDGKYTVTPDAEHAESAAQFVVDQTGNDFVNKEVTDIEVTKIWKSWDGINNEAWVKDITLILHKSRTGEAEKTYTYTVGERESDAGTVITAVSSDENAPAAVVSGNSADGYKISFIELDAGYEYGVTEETVDGYKDPEYARLTASTGEGDQFSTTGEGGETLTKAQDGGFIINRPYDAVELPESGGRGTALFTALGLLLIAFAGVMLRRRKRIV